MSMESQRKRTYPREEDDIFEFQVKSVLSKRVMFDSDMGE